MGRGDHAQHGGWGGAPRSTPGAPHVPRPRSPPRPPREARRRTGHPSALGLAAEGREGQSTNNGTALDPNTAQTPGIFRQAAINASGWTSGPQGPRDRARTCSAHRRAEDLSPRPGLRPGIAIQPNAKTGVHHHAPGLDPGAVLGLAPGDGAQPRPRALGRSPACPREGGVPHPSSPGLTRGSTPIPKTLVACPGESRGPRPLRQRSRGDQHRHPWSRPRRCHGSTRSRGAFNLHLHQQTRVEQPRETILQAQPGRCAS